jgi:hypothetical protein
MAKPHGSNLSGAKVSCRNALWHGVKPLHVDATKLSLCVVKAERFELELQTARPRRAVQRQDIGPAGSSRLRQCYFLDLACSSYFVGHRQLALFVH